MGVGVFPVDQSKASLLAIRLPANQQAPELGIGKIFTDGRADDIDTCNNALGNDLLTAASRMLTADKTGMTPVNHTIIATLSAT